MWQGENWALGDSRLEAAGGLGQERSMFQGGERAGHQGTMMPAGTRGRQAVAGASKQVWVPENKAGLGTVALG